MRNDLRHTNTSKSDARVLSRLNAVRALIVSVMAIGYASTMPLGPDYPEVFNLYGYDPSWLGIQVLFFLSGYLALRTVSKGRTGIAYLSSRFVRNIPLLAIVTLATLIVLFPLFGTPTDSGGAMGLRLLKYIALTVFCIDPGIPIQGLFDDAVYMCLVQGAIWTLRFGVILHVITAIAGRIGLLNAKWLLVWGTVSVTYIYIILTYFAEQKDISILDAPLTGLRLSYPFLFGMCVWAYREALYKKLTAVLLFACVIFGLASLKYLHVPWTPVTEIALTLFWASLSFVFLALPSRTLNLLRYCPNITLLLLMISWPMSQTLHMLYPMWSIPLLIVISVSASLILSLALSLIWTKLPTRLRLGSSQKLVS